MEKEHFEVILESIDSKFDLVLEGYSSLDKKIDDLAEMMEERFDLLDSKIDAATADLNHLTPLSALSPHS